MTQPLSITLIAPQDIHRHWEFVHRGLRDIIRKLGPRNVDFIPEDQYSAVRCGTSWLYVASRDNRNLAFVNCYVQKRGFSNRPELFIWALWALPLKERRPEDNFAEVSQVMRAHLIDLAVANGCDSLLGLSNRKGLTRLGFQQTVSAWRMWL